MIDINFCSQCGVKIDSITEHLKTIHPLATEYLTPGGNPVWICIDGLKGGTCDESRFIRNPVTGKVERKEPLPLK